MIRTTLTGEKKRPNLLPSKKRLARALRKSFKGLEDSSELVPLFTNKVQAILEYIQLCNGKKHVCQNTSLLFNPHRFEITKQPNSPLFLFDAFRNKKENWFNGLVRAFLFRGCQKGKLELGKNLLDTCIRMNVNGVMYVYEFPPHVARSYCLKGGVEVDGHVLDPCAGWGGRMLDISTVCNKYTCFEPETRTYHGLKQLCRFIQELQPHFKANIHCQPFEEAKLSANAYDMAITSPPYFNTEEYSKEDTNSLNRFDTFEKWVDGFYLPMIEKTMMALKPGKVFILNIGNRVYPLDEILMSHFGSQFEIKNMGNQIGGNGGLRSVGKGEIFFRIKKASE